MELIQKIDGQRARLHMFEVAQLANLIPQVRLILFRSCPLTVNSELRRYRRGLGLDPKSCSL
jgi:hypothetical protein